MGLGDATIATLGSGHNRSSAKGIFRAVKLEEVAAPVRELSTENQPFVVDGIRGKSQASSCGLKCILKHWAIANFRDRLSLHLLVQPRRKPGDAVEVASRDSIRSVRSKSLWHEWRPGS